MEQKTAVIIGAGPAGLTAAFELLKYTGIKPVVYEMTGDIGGISKTVSYQGNRIDMGGHRFFSKSDRVMQWWLDILPMQGYPSKDDIKLGRQITLSSQKNAPDPEKTDDTMLVRNRLSRILHHRHFYDYPLSLNLKTLKNLGVIRLIKIGLSYIKVCIFPIKPEKSLEDFFINRFGRELYLTFFKDYTEKVWGKPCNEIKPDWGVQRVKGLSIAKVISHAMRTFFLRDSSISQKKTETSLIEQFLYPKFGPGQMWQQVAKIIEEHGGKVILNRRVTKVRHENYRITAVEVRDTATGQATKQPVDYVFSSMPVRDLIEAMDDGLPQDVRQVAKGLLYRSFITIGLLLKKLKIKNDTKVKTVNDIIPDNWIYIQEADVKVGRLQVFNNWSPYMVEDEDKVWIGLEYFCDEQDQLWNKPDKEFILMAVEEMTKIGVIDAQDVLDGVVIRMPKAYPGYFGSYEHFDVIRKFTDKFDNLFLIGRTGMHRYNNQDHSMLSAMVAVENIINNVKTKDNIWAVNAEEEYHEEKK
jgi:protoporphyrinogen oxidase